MNDATRNLIMNMAAIIEQRDAINFGIADWSDISKANIARIVDAIMVHYGVEDYDTEELFS